MEMQIGASEVVQVLDTGCAVLPPESPLPMPEQSLRKGRLHVPRQRTAPLGIGLRRFYLIGGTMSMSLIATWVMLAVMWPGGINVLEGCLLVLFMFLFAWVTMSFASALAGFFCMVFGGGRVWYRSADAVA